LNPTSYFVYLIKQNDTTTYQMTEKQIKQRIKIIKDQLRLAYLYEEDFREKMNRKQFQSFIDTSLEELSELLELLDNL